MFKPQQLLQHPKRSFQPNQTSSSLHPTLSLDQLFYLQLWGHSISIFLNLRVKKIILPKFKNHYQMFHSQMNRNRILMMHLGSQLCILMTGHHQRVIQIVGHPLLAVVVLMINRTGIPNLQIKMVLLEVGGQEILETEMMSRTKTKIKINQRMLSYQAKRKKRRKRKTIKIRNMMRQMNCRKAGLISLSMTKYHYQERQKIDIIYDYADLLINITLSLTFQSTKIMNKPFSISSWIINLSFIEEQFTLCYNGVCCCQGLIQLIMNNKRGSKTSIKLPKLASSSVRSPEKSQRRSSKSEQNHDKLTALAYGIYDLSLNPIVQVNKNLRREIASLTKMMTMLCTVRLCKKYKINMGKCYFRVTPNAAGTRGTTAELQSREWATIEDLLHGLMLPSGNDAATVLAQNFGACIYYDRLGESHLLVVIDLKSLDLTEDTRNIKLYTEQFVKIMNQTAKEIGMKDTNYVNPHGLDCSFRFQAYSILEDQIILTKALLQNQDCNRIIGKTQHVGELKTINGKQVQIRKIIWQNTNLLLGHEGFIGGKTGQTQNAGNCLASIYQSKDKQRYIIVLLGCLTKQARFLQTKYLVEKYLSKNK